MVPTPVVLGAVVALFCAVALGGIPQEQRLNGTSTDSQPVEEEQPSQNHTYQLRCSPRRTLEVDAKQVKTDANFQMVLKMLCTLARTAAHDDVVDDDDDDDFAVDATRTTNTTTRDSSASLGYSFGFLITDESFVPTHYAVNSTENKTFELQFENEDTNSSDIYSTFSYRCQYGRQSHQFMIGERHLRRRSIAWVLLARLACRHWWEGRAPTDWSATSDDDDDDDDDDDEMEAALSAFARRLRSAAVPLAVVHRAIRDLRNNAVDDAVPASVPSAANHYLHTRTHVQGNSSNKHHYQVGCTPRQESLHVDGVEVKTTELLQSAVRHICSLLYRVPENSLYSLGVLETASSFDVSEYAKNSTHGKQLDLEYADASDATKPRRKIKLKLRVNPILLPVRARCSPPPARFNVGELTLLPHSAAWVLMAEAWCSHRHAHRHAHPATPPTRRPSPPPDDALIWRTMQMARSQPTEQQQVENQISQIQNNTPLHPLPHQVNEGKPYETHTRSSPIGNAVMDNVSKDEETMIYKSGFAAPDQGYQNDVIDPRNHSYALRCAERGALIVDGRRVKISPHMAASLFFLCALLVTSGYDLNQSEYSFGYIRTVERFRVDDVAVDSPRNLSLDVMYEGAIRPGSADVNIFWQTCRPHPPGPEFSLDSGPLLPRSILWSLFSRVRCGRDDLDEAFMRESGGYTSDDLVSEDMDSAPDGDSLVNPVEIRSDYHQYVIRCTPGAEQLMVDTVHTRLTPHMDSALGLLCFSAGLHDAFNSTKNLGRFRTVELFNPEDYDIHSENSKKIDVLYRDNVSRRDERVSSMMPECQTRPPRFLLNGREVQPGGLMWHLYRLLLCGEGGDGAADGDGRAEPATVPSPLEVVSNVHDYTLRWARNIHDEWNERREKESQSGDGVTVRERVRRDAETERMRESEERNRTLEREERERTREREERERTREREERERTQERGERERIRGREETERTREREERERTREREERERMQERGERETVRRREEGERTQEREERNRTREREQRERTREREERERMRERELRERTREREGK